MRIALDYDETYTLDPEFWDGFIKLCQVAKHEVKIVTVRHPDLDRVQRPPAEMIYTNGVAKKHFCIHEADWEPDVWIDDNPANILNNSSFTKEQLLSWRKVRTT